MDILIRAASRPALTVKRRCYMGSRASAVTRDKLLKAAFEEIYRSGFQATSLDIILTKARVTKGALYHYFPDKASLGYAVVDEVVKGCSWNVGAHSSRRRQIPSRHCSGCCGEEPAALRPERSSSAARSTTWPRKCPPSTSNSGSGYRPLSTSGSIRWPNTSSTARRRGRCAGMWTRERWHRSWLPRSRARSVWRREPRVPRCCDPTSTS